MKNPLEKAQWIECPVCPADTAPVFRITFCWTKAPEQRATLYISGLGFYTLRCNGRPVDDALLNPAFSRYDQTVYYNEISL